MQWLDLGQLVVLGHILLAMALGAVVGLEREAASKPAGFRTHMLVAGAAALLVALGEIMVAAQAAGNSSIRSDPVRIVEAVITGVSFLGAGTIIRLSGQGQVEGLTTGASLLFVAGVGICVAIQQYVVAVGCTLMVLVVLSGGRLLEQKRAGQNSSLRE